MNNQGWSLRFMLFLTTILIIVLLIGSFYVVKLSKSFDRTPKINETNPTEITPRNYEDLEEMLNKVCVEYIDKNYLEGIGNEVVTINLINLITYDEENNKILNDELKNCSGYSNAFLESNSINVSSYLKCKDYQTYGFSEFYLE